MNIQNIHAGKPRGQTTKFSSAENNQFNLLRPMNNVQGGHEIPKFEILATKTEWPFGTDAYLSMMTESGNIVMNRKIEG